MSVASGPELSGMLCTSYGSSDIFKRMKKSDCRMTDRSRQPIRGESEKESKSVNKADGSKEVRGII